MKLKNHDTLNNLYQDLGDNIQPFLNSYDKLNQTGKTPEDAIIISNHLEQLDLLRLSCHQKSRELTRLDLNVQTLSGNCQELNNQQNLLAYSNNMLKGQNYNLSLTNQYLLSEYSRIQSEYSRIQSAIQYLHSVGPAIINDVAGKEIHSILARNREILTLAAVRFFK